MKSYTRLPPRKCHRASFSGEYDDFYEKASTDIVSGDFFSSAAKYDVGCGWPAFSKPIQASEIVEKKMPLYRVRTEVRSAKADSHLGHVFGD